MESKERLEVRRSMNELKPYLAAYVATHSRVSGRTSERGDIAALLRTIVKEWDTVFSRQLPRAARSYVHELIDVRNRWAHEADFSQADLARALDTINQLAIAIGAPTAAQAQKPRVGRRSSQRQTMKDIYARCRGNEKRIVREYADAERNGEVQRVGRKSGYTPEQYALALLSDGLRKGWLP
jgi:hypothetical protein